MYENHHSLPACHVGSANPGSQPKPQFWRPSATLWIAAVLVSSLGIVGCATPQRPLPPAEAPRVLEPIEDPALSIENPREALRAAETRTDDLPRVRHAIDRVLVTHDANQDRELLRRAESLWRLLEAQASEDDFARGALLAALREDFPTAEARLGGSLGAWRPSDDPIGEQHARRTQVLLAQSNELWWPVLLARVGLDDTLWEDPIRQTENQRAIWNALAMLPAPLFEDRGLRQEAMERNLRSEQAPVLHRAQYATLDGWIALHGEVRKLERHETLGRAIRNWSSDYPVHPASALLPDLQSAQRARQEADRNVANVALLLPLSGQFSELGRAVLEGALAAAYETSPALQLDVHDTRSDPAEAVRVYRSALTAGADAIIGPLSPAATGAVLRERSGRDVPLLLLNRPDADRNATLPWRTSVLALAPEGDGIAAAQHAMRQGRASAAVFSSGGSVAERAITAFTQELEAGGGRVVERVDSSRVGRELSRELDAVMQIADSEARRARVVRASGIAVESDPQVRGDIDVLYLPGLPQDVRSIAPFLHYLRAGDKLWLGTQHLNDPGASRISDDLQRIQFPEAPWVLDADASAPRLASEVRSRPAAAELMERLPRFVALGIDAVRLARSDLDALELDPARGVQGVLGDWHLRPYAGTWQRTPQWAQGVSGQIETITASAPLNTSLPGEFDGDIDRNLNGDFDRDSNSTETNAAPGTIRRSDIPGR